MKKLLTALSLVLGLYLVSAQKTNQKETAPPPPPPAQQYGAKKQSTQKTVPLPANSQSAKMKKDGTPDKRYKANQHLKKDGTPDKRYKKN